MTCQNPFDSVDDDHLWVAQVTDTGSTRSTPLSRNDTVGDYATVFHYSK